MIRPSLILAGLAALAAVAPAAEAAPRLVSAASSDRDGDGRVDSVSVRFSGKVKGKGRFSVAGLRVASAAKARGRRVQLRMVEGDACDVGLRPRVRYRSGLKTTRGAKLRASSVDMERRDRRRPRLTCAVTRDADGDGHVDGLALTWSTNVRGGVARAFKVQGFSVRGLSRPKGRMQSLTLGEHGAADSGATPPVSYARVRRGGVRAAKRGRARTRRGQALPGGLTSTRDGVAPVLVSAWTGDTDADGLVDAVSASFSESVRSAPGLPSVEGAQVSAEGTDGGDVTVGLTEGSLGTGARPRLSYGAGELTDAAGNAVGAFTATPEDAAGPVITAATSADHDANGRLDALVVTFSEAVSHAADSDGSYPLEVPDYALTEVGGANGQTLELSLGQRFEPDTGVRPSLRYVGGAGSPVLDAAGNEARSATFAATADGAPPVLTGARTIDSDEDGRLDLLRFRFSEVVIHVLGPGAFGAQGLTALAPEAADGTTVDVALTEAGSANTGLAPLAFYVPPGPGSVSDLAGNVAPPGSATAEDGAGPVVVDASTGDVDSDSKIDRVSVTMSEPVTYPGDSTAPFSVEAVGYGVASVSPASGSSFTIDLVEPSGPDTGGAPAISYSAGGSLRDLAGLEAIPRSYDGRTRDTLPPSFVTAQTDDDDGDGRIDRVDLLYSEDVQGGTSFAPFTVSGRTVTGIEFADASARIVIDEAVSPDTDEQPSASYTPPVDPAQRVTDVPEGPGDTAQEALAQGLVQAADRAKPAIVGAVTGDAAGAANGRLDRVALTFSEPVSHAEELTAPFSIALGGGHSVSAVTAAAGDQMTVNVAEASEPDGGSTPSATVVGPAEITDAASNPANETPFSGTQDGVRPVLVSAQLGERDSGGACVPSPPQNGILDCMNVTWSEPVDHADDPTLSFGAPFSADPPIPGVSGSSLTDVPLVEAGSPNREDVTDVSYTEGAPVPVVDGAGNEAITTTPPVVAGAACVNDLFEPNDSRDPGNPAVAGRFAAYLCALDEDWYRIVPEADGEVHVMMDLAPGATLTVQLWDETGGAPIATATSAGAGTPVVLDVPGPLGDPNYWVRVVGGGLADEAEYCLDTAFEPGGTCSGGGGDPL